MSGMKQTARVLEVSDNDARHVWPTMTPAEAERGKDAAFAVMVALMQAGRDAGACRAQYMNHVAMFERAAGFGD